MNPGVAQSLVKAKPPRILGYQLRPFSAAHFIALAGSNWPGVAEPRHLVLALDICSRPVDPVTCLPAAFPDRSPGWRGLLTLAVIAVRPMLFFRACSAFAAYLNDQKATVELAKVKGVRADLFTGDETLASVMLAMRSGMSRYEASSIPLGTLSAYVAQGAVLDQRGARIRNTEEEDADLAKHQQLMESIANG